MNATNATAGEWAVEGGLIHARIFTTDAKDAKGRAVGFRAMVQQFGKTDFAAWAHKTVDGRLFGSTCSLRRFSTLEEAKAYALAKAAAKAGR